MPGSFVALRCDAIHTAPSNPRELKAYVSSVNAVVVAQSSPARCRDVTRLTEFSPSNVKPGVTAQTPAVKSRKCERRALAGGSVKWLRGLMGGPGAGKGLVVTTDLSAPRPHNSRLGASHARFAKP